MRLRPDSTAGESAFPLIMCMEPGDYTVLDHGEIDDEMLAVAHELAAEFLRAAGL